eukprot:512652_1
MYRKHVETANSNHEIPPFSKIQLQLPMISLSVDSPSDAASDFQSSDAPLPKSPNPNEEIETNEKRQTLDKLDSEKEEKGYDVINLAAQTKNELEEHTTNNFINPNPVSPTNTNTDVEALYNYDIVTKGDENANVNSAQTKGGAELGFINPISPTLTNTEVEGMYAIVVANDGMTNGEHTNGNENVITVGNNEVTIE